MTASDAESISLRDLLAMATPEDREEFEGMWLGYTETFGAADLRESIASTYTHRNASEILCFAGASEGIFAANSVILDKDSHAIVVTPNYQTPDWSPSIFHTTRPGRFFPLIGICLWLSCAANTASIFCTTKYSTGLVQREPNIYRLSLMSMSAAYRCVVQAP